MLHNNGKLKLQKASFFIRHTLTLTGQNRTDSPKSYFFGENPILNYENLVQSNFYPHELGVLGSALHDGRFCFFERNTLSTRFWRGYDK